MSFSQAITLAEMTGALPVLLGLLGPLGHASSSPAGCYNHGECLGGTLIDTGVGVPSLEACLGECQAAQACQAVTYFPGKDYQQKRLYLTTCFAASDRCLLYEGCPVLGSEDACLAQGSQCLSADSTCDLCYVDGICEGNTLAIYFVGSRDECVQACQGQLVGKRGLLCIESCLCYLSRGTANEGLLKTESLDSLPTVGLKSIYNVRPFS